MLEVQRVGKRWKEFELRDVSFRIERREYFVLVGPSGAGKTLLLEIIAGIRRPDEGRIVIGGKDVTDLPPEERGVSYVPQSYALFPHMSVLDNITYGLRIRGMSRSEAEKKATGLVRTLGIEHLLNRKPHCISAGEQQRVALARALVVEPILILLDEPFANLDMRIKSRLMSEMKRWREELGFTALHVTHSFEEVMVLGDKLGVLLHGRLRRWGKIGDVISDPGDEDVAKFLGYENVLEGMAEDGCLRVGELNVILPFTVSGKVRVCFRPEDVLLSVERIDSSARNQFKGRITEMEDLGPLFRITVDLDNDIVVRSYVTKASVLEMGLREGSKVYVSIKASSLKVF